MSHSLQISVHWENYSPEGQVAIIGEVTPEVAAAVMDALQNKLKRQVVDNQFAESSKKV